jgi:hypothetical protein
LRQAGHHVGGDRQELERDEHADEVARRCHHHHAQDARQQQHVVLALVIAALFDLVGRQQHDDVAAQQEEGFQHEAEVVDHVAIVEHRSHVAADDSQRDDWQERTEQDEARQRGEHPPLALTDEQVDQQHHADPGTEHDLGRERVIVDRR